MLPGVLGSIQATEAIKLITGIGVLLIGRLLTYDALELRFREFRFQRRTDCAVCGDRPRITALHDPAPSPAAAMPGVRHWSAADLRDALRDGPSTNGLVLVDVREPREFALQHLDQALNIPLDQLPERLPELAGRQPVFICQSGVRSLQACAIAGQHGVAEPGHLVGGLRNWPVG